jgi:hybrid cluster-associated redox disulfide protein
MLEVQIMITKDMGIIEIVNKYPETADVFFKYGMHCLGCMAARFETLEQGALAHGIDVEAMVKDLNEAINK